MDIQRYKVGYYSDEWGMSSNTPCLLKDSNGYAVKYEDHVKEITALRTVCAEAYQFAGAHNAPVEVMDNLCAAMLGEPLPHETFLPVAAPDAGEIERLRHNLQVTEETEKRYAELAKLRLDEIERLRFALENCRLLAARHRKEDWALLILGFCAEGGVVGSITRSES